MSDNWQPGDLALCVNDGPAERGAGWVETRADWLRNLRRGAIYTVTHISAARFSNGIGLFDAGRHAGGNASRFRKIHPHTPDAEDRETIRLMNGVPEPVSP